MILVETAIYRVFIRPKLDKQELFFVADENRIGLAELIEQVKRELLTPVDKETDIPLLSVEEVELELQVTVKKEGKGGIKIYVLELGGGGSRDDVQKVKVKLSPIINKEMLLSLYRKRHPERLEELVKESMEGVFKGGEVDDQF